MLCFFVKSDHAHVSCKLRLVLLKALAATFTAKNSCQIKFFDFSQIYVLQKLCLLPLTNESLNMEALMSALLKSGQMSRP